MEIRTIGSRIDVDSALDAYVKRRIHFALGRFSNRVERVSVVLSHENGPNGGMSKTPGLLPSFGANLLEE